MLTTYNEIRQEILDNWEYLEELNDNGVDDYLNELADSQTPIYYGDIIEEWKELPMEFSNTWKEYPIQPDSTITSLMATDLFNYYNERYSEIYEAVKTEKESESDN